MRSGAGAYTLFLLLLLLLLVSFVLFFFFQSTCDYTIHSSKAEKPLSSQPLTYTWAVQISLITYVLQIRRR